MTEIPLGVFVLVGAFVFSILFLAWSLLLPKLGAMMSAALVADCVLGLVGVAYFVRIDRTTGAILSSAAFIGFCVISAALWIRPTCTKLQGTELGSDAQSKAPE